MNIFVLEVKFDWNGTEQALYPVILQNERETILVDGGYPGFLPLLEDAAQQQGLSLQQLTGVLVTHHDNDHMGVLCELKDRYPHVKVCASKEEEPYISGRKTSLRLQQAEALFDCLPEEQKEGALQFQEMLKRVWPAVVDETINEEGELSFLKGANIIFTPGHMPGHLSIYLPNEKTLVAADALVYENGELAIANPSFTLDLPEAVQSVKKLQQLAIEKIICYHGGLVTSGIQQGLANIIAAYPQPSSKSIV